MLYPSLTFKLILMQLTGYTRNEKTNAKLVIGSGILKHLEVISRYYIQEFIFLKTSKQ